VSPGQALWLFLSLLALAAPLLFFLNWPTRWLSLGAIFLAVTYPFTKRVTHLPQVYLGAAFGWAIPMAYAAHERALSWEVWWLYLITILWAVIYDTMYAMVDREDDLRAGVKSTAILFGQFDRAIIGLLQLTVILLWYALALYLQLSSIFYLFLLLGVSNFLYQQILIRDGAPENCFKAFLIAHWFGAVIFVGLLLGYRIA
jgi:4-hydroxybenzoate polyprenyltransferase